MDGRDDTARPRRHGWYRRSGEWRDGRWPEAIDRTGRPAASASAADIADIGGQPGDLAGHAGRRPGAATRGGAHAHDQCQDRDTGRGRCRDGGRGRDDPGHDHDTGSANRHRRRPRPPGRQRTPGELPTSPARRPWSTPPRDSPRTCGLSPGSSVSRRSAWPTLTTPVLARCARCGGSPGSNSTSVRPAHDRRADRPLRRRPTASLTAARPSWTTRAALGVRAASGRERALRGVIRPVGFDRRAVDWPRHRGLHGRAARRRGSPWPAHR